MVRGSFLDSQSGVSIPGVVNGSHPHPVFICPSLLPQFNPTIRIFDYESLPSQNEGIPQVTLLRYTQWMSDLVTWTKLWNSTLTSSSDNSNSTKDLPPPTFQVEYRTNVDYEGAGVNLSHDFLELAKLLGYPLTLSSHHNSSIQIEGNQNQLVQDKKFSFDAIRKFITYLTVQTEKSEELDDLTTSVMAIKEHGDEL